MTDTVEVRASRNYQVLIGPGLLDELGERLAPLCRVGTAVVIAGENVFPLYGETALQSLRAAGLETASLVFPAGEGTKCLRRYGELVEFLAEKRLTRSDCVIALGGGVTGDLAGFAAATYQRGLAYVFTESPLILFVFLTYRN